jgi:hypothetical protein
MGLGKKYSKKEDEFIIKSYTETKMNREQIAEALHRTVPSLEHRLFQLKLKREVHKYWEEHEKEYIRLHYKGTDASKLDMAKALGRTRGSVDHCVRMMGLQKYRCNLWKPSDDEYLKENVGRYSVQIIANRLHRSPNAVVIRLKMLKLHRRNKDGWYSTKEIADIFGCSAGHVRGLIESGKLIAERHGIGGAGNMWEVRRAAAKNFICRYPDELQNRNVDILQFVDILTANGVKYNLQGVNSD